MLSFLADECFDHSLVSLLRSQGYDVKYQIEEEPGAPDDEILRLKQTE